MMGVLIGGNCFLVAIVIGMSYAVAEAAAAAVTFGGVKICQGRGWSSDRKKLNSEVRVSPGTISKKLGELELEFLGLSKS